MFLTNVNILHAQNTNPIGAIPSTIDVSPMGAASYTIPIEVVSGTQGIQPNLSIVYNSFGGMGLLGMKWNLAGLSAITRCGQTPYFDSNLTAIQFGSSNDRLTLDGERLININGNYGANGTEYATETENFTRIVQYGTSSAWRTFYFKVYTDNGTVIEYGNTNDSKLFMILPLRPDATILSWQISKITDANGNYMTFHYGFNFRETWISEINYTGNDVAGILPYANVKFNYDTIPATLGANTYFVGGYDLPQTRLLNSITIKYGNDVVRKYKFNYNTSVSGERTAHLKEVVLYGEGGTQQLNSTTITWDTQNNIIEDASLSVSTGSIVTGDFNGDGYTDYVVYNKVSGAKITFQLYLYNPATNAFYPQDQPKECLSSYAYSCDFDGDGRDELILAECVVASGINTYKISAWHYDNEWRQQSLGTVEWFFQAHLGDFTGDGKVNIMYESRKIEGNKIKYTLSFSNNGNLSSSALTFYDIDDIRIIDYNGNGKANIQIIKGNDPEIYEYSSTLNKCVVVAQRDFPTKYSKVYYGDFNGDGITDIIQRVYSPASNPPYYYLDRVEFLFGKGNGNYETCNNKFNIPFSQWEGGPYIYTAKYNLFIADINGDGKDDIIQVIYNSNTNKTTLYIFYSKGYANGNYQFSYAEKVIDGDYSNIENIVSDNLWHLGDFNGDGKMDLLIRKSKNDSSPKIIYFNKNEQYEYVKQITDGMGKETNIAYTPQYLSFVSSSLGRDKKAFMYLASEIQTSNGIGNGVNSLKFRYWNPIYASQRRTFLGFMRFVTTNTMDNITTIDSLFSIPYYMLYPATLDREILLPQYEYLTKTVSPYTINQVSYSYTIVPLTNPRFILHNHLIREQDYLSDTKTEITTTLENGRLKTNNTKTYNGSNSSIWLHSETNTYSYNTITLNGNQKKTVPTQILTTQQYGSGGLIIADTVTYNYFTSGTNKGRLNWKRQGNTDGSITTTYGSYTNAGLAQEKTVSAAGVTPRKEYYEYDNTNRFITKIKNHFLHEATMVYNTKTGSKLSETDINGLTTTYYYDTFGRLKQINYPEGTVTKDTIYWFTGSNPPNAQYCTKTTSSGKPNLTVYYDKLGREVCRLDDGYYYDTRYNAKGQAVKTSYPYSPLNTSDTKKIWSTYTYDNFGRKSTENAPYTDLSYHHDLIDKRKVIVTDNLRNVSSWKNYDALGRIIQAKDSGGTITYNYAVINENNKKRHQTTITTNGSTTWIKSDLWGNRLSINEPNAGLITSEYNKFNELVKQTDAKGNITIYEYDFLGRVTHKQITGSGNAPLNIQYIYDHYNSNNRGKGKLYQIRVNSVVEETYTYNNLSRLFIFEKVIDNTPYTFSYDYTPSGQLHAMVYPDDFIVTYSYSSTGKLKEIRDGSLYGNNSLIYKVDGRNEFGATTLCSYGNGLVTEYTYNPYGLLTHINTGNKKNIGIEGPNLEKGATGGLYTADSTILNYRYGYDNKGLMISRSESIINRLETYEYDKLDRLTHITSGTMKKPQPPQIITYAPNGNITYNPNAGYYTYGSKPHAVTQIEPINNNVISSNQCAVTYNFFNQPTHISEVGNHIDLFYGFNQQRNKAEIERSDDMSFSYYTRYYINKYYEVEQRIHRPIPPPQNYHYIYGDNGIVALHVDQIEPLNYSSEDSIYYIHTDHLGSYCAITNANKQVIMRNYFDPWGNFILRDYTPYFQGFPITNRGFTGHEHYPELKIINMNGRLYDPVIGRFFSPDKYVANSSFTQDFNRYSYCRNNPLSYSDPDGEFLNYIFGAIAGGLMNWAFNGFQFNLQGLAYFGIGAAAGAATAGMSVLMGGAVGSLGFASGAITAGTAGFAGGFITGAGNSWMQGNNFGQGLLSGLKTGGMGALMGGVMGGIQGGCEAWVAGGDIMTGEGSRFEFLVPESESGPIKVGKDMDYSTDYAKKFSDRAFRKNIKGLGKLYANGDYPSGHYSGDGVNSERVYVSSTNKQTLGSAVYKGWGKTDVYLYKAAFTSMERLYLTMGHEYLHVGYNTLPNFLDADAKHHNEIAVWEYNQARLWNFDVEFYQARYNTYYNPSATRYSVLNPNNFGIPTSNLKPWLY
jgi:RHS repeat-associated protein